MRNYFSAYSFIVQIYFKIQLLRTTWTIKNFLSGLFYPLNLQTAGIVVYIQAVIPVVQAATCHSLCFNYFPIQHLNIQIYVNPSTT